MKAKLTQYLMAGGVLALMTQLATAETFTVSNTSDDVTNTGSLRWAINQANNHGNNSSDPFDTVAFDPTFFAVPRTITLQNDELALTGTLHIVGPGSDLLTINGNGAHRAFYLQYGHVAISGMTITNGWAYEGSTSTGSGSQGGAIHNEGSMVLNDIKFIGNRAQLTSYGALTRGGAIYNSGTLNMTNCVVEQNFAKSTENVGAQESEAFGGGIYNIGHLVAVNTIIRDNQADAIRLEVAANMLTVGNGGGVFSDGPNTTAIFDHCTISSNTASGSMTESQPGIRGEGGGIYASGMLTLTNGCVIESNTAIATIGWNLYASSDALYVHGGGLFFGGGTATVSRCTIRINLAMTNTNNLFSSVLGGGVYNAGTMTIRDTTISSNLVESLGTGSVNANGGGLYSYDIGNGPGTALINCAIIGNGTLANGVLPDKSQGGGIYASSAVSVLNSTVAGNTCMANGYYPQACGGGFFAYTGNSVVRNSTLVDNACNTGIATSGVFQACAGGIDVGSSVVDLGNTIVAGNVVQPGGDTAYSPDTLGPITSRGHNLIGDPSGGSGFATNDITSVPATNVFVDADGSGTIDANDLAGHGGPTVNLALKPGSPAIDAGDNALIPIDPDTSAPVTTDQRGTGFPRVFGGTVDIGAYESMLLSNPNEHVFEAFVNDDFLNPTNWISEGTSTPADMAAGDTYIVIAPAVLSGSAVVRGTLQIDPNASMTVGAAGSLDLDAGCQVTNAGTLSVAGLLRTTGNGTSTIAANLVLDNTNSLSQVLEIPQGTTLQNNGSVLFQAGKAMVSGTWQHNQNPLTVLAGATLAGAGTLGGSVDVYGRIEPGPDTGYGDLTIQGNFTHYSTATTRIRVGGNSAGEFDRILVNGVAALGGTLVVDFTNRPLAAAGTYVFLVPTSGTMFGYLTRTPVNLAPTRSFSYAYDISSDRFTIAATGTPYQDWAYASGLTLGVNDAPSFSASGDGVPNIVHFAFDTAPLGPGGDEGKRATGVITWLGANHLVLIVPVRTGAVFTGSPSPAVTIDGIVYTIQGSADLQTWTQSVSEIPISTALPPLDDLDGDGTPDWQYHTFILDAPALTNGFMRTTVQLAP